MLVPMTDYFTAEKQESLLFVIVGIIALAAALWLWMNGHRLKSMAFPLVAIALIQIVVGGSVFLRTNKQLADLSHQAATSPAVFKQTEADRMQVVMKNFSIYRAIEMTLIAVGMGLIFFMQRYDMATGIGAGLVLQSAFMLSLDMFAEARGQDYVAALAAFTG